MSWDTEVRESAAYECSKFESGPPIKMESLMEPHKSEQTMASATRKEEITGSLFKSSIFDSVTPFEVLMVEEFSDLNLVIGSHIIGVHQLVLASHSKLIAGDNYFLLLSMKYGVN